MRAANVNNTEVGRSTRARTGRTSILTGMKARGSRVARRAKRTVSAMLKYKRGSGSNGG